MQLAFPPPPRLDRRLVHRQHLTLQNRRQQCVVDRLQQRGRALYPLRQRAPTQADARMGQPLMLTIEREMVAKLVQQQACQDTDIGKTLL